MRSAAKAFGALWVIGTLFVPYAQPGLCDWLMPGGMTMSDHEGHPTGASPASVLQVPADDGTTCAPACVPAQAASLSVPVWSDDRGPDLKTLERAMLGFASVPLSTTAPPPKT